MVEKRKLPWGMLAALLVGLLVISYFLSGLTTLDGVTLANWQDKLLYVILHPLQNWWNDLHCNIPYGLLSQPTGRCGVWIGAVGGYQTDPENVNE